MHWIAAKLLPLPPWVGWFLCELFAYLSAISSYDYEEARISGALYRWYCCWAPSAL